jgi:hypothetical protein
MAFCGGYEGCVAKIAFLDVPPLTVTEIQRQWEAYVMFVAAEVYVDSSLGADLKYVTRQDLAAATKRLQFLHDAVIAQVDEKSVAAMVNVLNNEHKTIAFTVSLTRRYLDRTPCFTWRRDRREWVHFSSRKDCIREISDRLNSAHAKVR